MILGHLTECHTLQLERFSVVAVDVGPLFSVTQHLFPLLGETRIQSLLTQLTDAESLIVDLHVMLLCRGLCSLLRSSSYGCVGLSCGIRLHGGLTRFAHGDLSKGICLDLQHIFSGRVVCVHHLFQNVASSSSFVNLS